MLILFTQNVQRLDMHFKYDNIDGTFNLGDIIFVKRFNATTKNVTHVNVSQN